MSLYELRWRYIEPGKPEPVLVELDARSHLKYVSTEKKTAHRTIKRLKGWLTLSWVIILVLGVLIALTGCSDYPCPQTPDPCPQAKIVFDSWDYIGHHESRGTVKNIGTDTAFAVMVSTERSGSLLIVSTDPDSLHVGEVGSFVGVPSTWDPGTGMFIGPEVFISWDDRRNFRESTD